MNQPHLSRIALCGYRQLLTEGAERQRALSEICRNLGGMSFSERLLADIDLFQNAGLDEIDAATRRKLLDWYGTEVSNPYAQEIAAWLRGEHVFDPQCLTS